MSVNCDLLCMEREQTICHVYLGAIVTCSFLCVCASYKSHWFGAVKFSEVENLLKNY